MRSATELITALNQCGITLVATDGVLRATPGSALTPELRAEIVAQKPALLAILARPAAPSAFTGSTPDALAAAAPSRKPPAADNVTLPDSNVTQTALRLDPEPLDPTDFSALRQVLETAGRFVPAPPDPPWQDPRPDLAADRSRWWLVLEAAYRLDGQDPNGLYGALYGMRCCGARLEIANAATYSLAPEGPPPTYRLVRGEELSEAAYADLRQRYLMPHRAALTRLLSAPTAARFTGSRPARAPAAPRKNGAQQQPPAQPALLAVAPVPAPALIVGGDW